MADPMACPDCREYYKRERIFLVTACKAVMQAEHILGLNKNRTAGDALKDYMQGYHDSGHNEHYAREQEET